MKPPPTSPSEPTVSMQEKHMVQQIQDYTLSYTNMKMEITDDVQSVYPRIGFLIFFFIKGSDYESRMLNYNRSDSYPYHLYVTGLFSQGSVLINQRGVSEWRSLKIHPVIGYYLLKTPMHLLTDHQVQVNYVLDREALYLRTLEADRQIDSFDNPYFIDFLQRILPEKSLYQRDPIYHAVNSIMARNGRVNVKKLAAHCNMSERTLRRQFLEKVGLSPQAYAKIWQIQHAMELLQQQPDAGLMYIAHEAGYYDVAHLAHDFKTKVSLTPTEFLQSVNPITESYLNHPTSLQ